MKIEDWIYVAAFIFFITALIYFIGARYNEHKEEKFEKRDNQNPSGFKINQTQPWQTNATKLVNKPKVLKMSEQMFIYLGVAWSPAYPDFSFSKLRQVH